MVEEYLRRDALRQLAHLDGEDGVTDAQDVRVIWHARTVAD